MTQSGSETACGETSAPVSTIRDHLRWLAVVCLAMWGGGCIVLLQHSIENNTVKVGHIQQLKEGRGATEFKLKSSFKDITNYFDVIIRPGDGKHDKLDPELARAPVKVTVVNKSKHALQVGPAPAVLRDAGVTPRDAAYYLTLQPDGSGILFEGEMSQFLLRRTQFTLQAPTGGAASLRVELEFATLRNLRQGLSFWWPRGI